MLNAREEIIKMTDEYGIKGYAISIKFTSRASVKVGDSFYTVEACEERYIPAGADISKERAALWDTVNTECDNQIAEIIKTYRK